MATLDDEKSNQPFAIVRVRDLTFRLRWGDVGEPRFVVEPLSGYSSPERIGLFQSFANGYHPELANQYLPHPTLSVAKVIVKQFRGELLDFSPTGKGPDEPGIYA